MEENTEFSMFEDRAYANPSLSRDERLQFIDTLRDTQTANTQQINADTYALGSQLPSNLGGLSGAENTFIARYQTPQTNQAVANLRLAAQQSALNTALSNLQNAYKKRYNDAILNYQKRAATETTTNNNDKYAGGVDLETPQTAGEATSSVASSQVPDSTVATIDDETVITDSNTGDIISTSKPENHQNPEGWYLTNKVDRYGRKIVKNANNGLELTLEEFEMMGGKL